MKTASNAPDSTLLYKIAKAYYEDNLTQQQIAGRFGLSRIKVSRMLSRAREAGIVQITINPPSSPNAGLEREVEARYGLKEAVVVNSPGDSGEITAELGMAVARYLMRTLQPGAVVAVSWGNTLLSMVDCLPAASFPDVRIVQMIGGLGELEAKVHGAELTRRMAQVLGARPRLLHAPGIVKSRAVRDALVSDPQVYGTLELASCADIAVVGIGALNAGSTLLDTKILSDEEIDQLKAAGAVGDIALQFFDATGAKVDTALASRIVGLEADAIRKVPRIVGVAGGKDKTDVIRAALQGKLINVLITDEEVASGLLEDQPAPTRVERE